jgi:biopolymer transport protein ExbD
MAIQMRNKRSAEFSMASMSDLVFLLLIFFMLTSTLVSPNAVKLLLPNSNSRTIAKQNVDVSITENLEYWMGEKRIMEEALVSEISGKLAGQPDATVVLRADKTVPVQYIVTVIDAVNQVNESTKTSHKVILATKPKPNP